MRLPEILGFFFGMLLFFTVLLSVFTHSLIQNALIILLFLVINLLVGFVFPSLFPSSGVFGGLKSGLRFFGEKLNWVVVAAVLGVVYVFAVGIVFVLSRIAGRKFLSMKFNRTAWKKKDLSKLEFDEMF